MTPKADNPRDQVMQCMELWGGNRDIDTALATQGLDAWVFSRPYRGDQGDAKAGGDIHYLTSCATGRITRMLLADVSGHGETVAEAARSLRRLLGQHANYIDQTRFVSAVDRRFGDLGGAGEGLFATAIVATYFSPTDELTLCSAGHPPALRYSAKDRAWSVISPPRAGDGPSNLPLGVLEGSPYLQSSIVLGEGDLVLLYTDALTEALGADGSQLGIEGVVRLASETDASAPVRIIPDLLGRIRAASGGGGADFDDDVSVMLIRRNALKPKPSIALAIRAGLRIVGNVMGSVARGVRPALPERSVRALGGAFLPSLNRTRG